MNKETKLGDHKLNPGATGYQGALPAMIPGGEVSWLVVPSKAFEEQIRQMREAGVEGPITCREKDRDVVLVALAQWTVPLRTVPQSQWPMSQVPMGELGRMPLIEFKQRHKDNFEKSGMKHCADSIVINDTGEIAEG